MRLTLDKTSTTAYVGLHDMALRGGEFVEPLTSVVEEFGCVGHYVDENLLSLAGPSRKPPAARSPPDRRFAPPLPLFDDDRDVRVVQLWGLRHCVLAAKEHLEGVLSTTRTEFALSLGPDAVGSAEYAFAQHYVNVPGVSSSVCVPPNSQQTSIHRVTRAAIGVAVFGPKHF